MKIIGLGAYSRVGKDSLANFMLAHAQEMYPRTAAIKCPFAWKLKQIAYELYGWAGMQAPEYYESRYGEKYRDVVLPAIGKTPVEVWVAMGTPAIRNCVYDRTWIDYVLKTDHKCDLLIIPDVRFPNEVEAIRELGGAIVKVVRPGYGPRDTVADQALIGYSDWDFVVGAVGTMNHLHWWAQRLVNWQLGDAHRPHQTPAERNDAMSVEVIAT